ncbi:MAG: bifunctional methylenetetrahydrofolate dehydrogenase/methenyltetrahydrofolate cyclohydrolase FolD [Clostridia bacterium]|nr:bifunctional methylenetetrahydrofolate dehydrogenase/methenyltetrahydrofolate cyclohydrolase FolD [Clostridia bacterium]
MSVRLDGKALAAKIKREVAAMAEKRTADGKARPALAVILVGEDPASAVYVRNKEKDCAECGIVSVPYKLPADYGEEGLLRLIDRLNLDPGVHGILVQLPLPPGYEERRVIERISPEKDVDAFHPVNVGRMTVGEPGFLPCTPSGIVALLDEYGIDPTGKRCVVVGRSNIVGKPTALLLLRRNGTVTVAHSRTADLPSITREADILVSAVGKAGFITADMVKPGAVIIDVGMNRSAEGKLCGDVDFEACEPLASYITPVPGGVGPMTRAILMRNTLYAAERADKNESIN